MKSPFVWEYPPIFRRVQPINPINPHQIIAPLIPRINKYWVDTLILNSRKWLDAHQRKLSTAGEFSRPSTSTGPCLDDTTSPPKYLTGSIPASLLISTVDKSTIIPSRLCLSRLFLRNFFWKASSILHIHIYIYIYRLIWVHIPVYWQLPVVYVA